MRKPWQLTATASAVPVWDPAVPGSNEVAVQWAIGIEGLYQVPYTVPDGWTLALTDAHFVSKHVEYAGNNRNSYMHLIVYRPDQNTEMVSVADGGADLSLRTPFQIAGGSVIHWGFSNSSPEPQNMSGVLTGELVECA